MLLVMGTAMLNQNERFFITAKQQRDNDLTTDKEAGSIKNTIFILLAVIFAISLMPVALAHSTATITAYYYAWTQVGRTSRQ